MANIIRPDQYPADTSYEPPLVIGFGIDSHTVEHPPAAMGRTVVPPGGRNQAHFHARSDACIFVISGSLRFFIGDPRGEPAAHVAHAGDFVHVPRGEIHGTENVSDTEEAQLVFCYPGVPDKEAAETVFVE
jgi:oxalate decarboxylase/phosphoglucose isomerase-like protein (cupin superfamily)